MCWRIKHARANVCHAPAGDLTARLSPRTQVLCTLSHTRGVLRTLSVCFKLLPWQPVPTFTGVSEYTLDAEGYVIRQQDYWDSINLAQGGYAAKGKLVGLGDFVGQLKQVRSWRWCAQVI
jgi:hypothetical protein